MLGAHLRQKSKAKYRTPRIDLPISSYAPILIVQVALKRKFNPQFLNKTAVTQDIIDGDAITFFSDLFILQLNFTQLFSLIMSVHLQIGNKH